MYISVLYKLPHNREGAFSQSKWSQTQYFDEYFWQKCTTLIHILLIFAPRKQQLYQAGISPVDSDNINVTSCIFVVSVLNAEKTYGYFKLWWQNTHMNDELQNLFQMNALCYTL